MHVPALTRVPDSFTVSHGVGSLIWDTDGHELIDFASGVLVLAAGHSNPRVTDAITAQAGRLMNCYAHDTLLRDELAERLVATTRGDFDQAFFMSTGSEAIEAALKVARAVTGRSGVVAFSDAFHGKTGAGVALGEAQSRDIFGDPTASPVIRACYPYPFRWNLTDDPDGAALTLLDQQIQMEGAERIGAIVLEPFLGAGGVVPSSARFLEGVRAIADRWGILVILDEIQSGLGRGGYLWTYQKSRMVPDILVGAKHLGGGMPICGLLSSAAIFDEIPAGSLTSTFGGNPLACAASLASLENIQTDGLVEQCRSNAKTVADALAGWQSEFGIVGEGRNAGLSCGIEIVYPGSKIPMSAISGQAKRIAAERGLLVMPAAGGAGNVIRFGPALNIPEDLLLKGLDRLYGVLEELSRIDPPLPEPSDQAYAEAVSTVSEGS